MHIDLVEVHPFSCLKDFFMLGEGGLRGVEIQALYSFTRCPWPKRLI